MHLGRLARFPTSLLLVSCFRAARRQRITCKSGHTPGSGHPVTNPHQWCLENEAFFFVPTSHFTFVPAFSFSTLTASTFTTLLFTLLELFYSGTQSPNLIILSPRLFLPLPLLFLSQLALTEE